MTSSDQPALRGPDWPAETADRVEAVVTGIRDRTVRPLQTAARVLVFGVLVGVLTQVALVLITVGLVRLIDAYLFPKRVWATYALLGGIFSLAGSLLWTRRRSKR